MCLSSLRRNLLLKVNKMVSYLNKKSLRVFEFRGSYVLYMFYRYEHYMSILHIAIFMYMATQHCCIPRKERRDHNSCLEVYILLVYLRKGRNAASEKQRQRQNGLCSDCRLLTDLLSSAFWLSAEAWLPSPFWELADCTSNLTTSPGVESGCRYKIFITPARPHSGSQFMWFLSAAPLFTQAECPVSKSTTNICQSLICNTTIDSLNEIKSLYLNVDIEVKSLYDIKY